MGRAMRAISRMVRRRTGEAKNEVLELTAKTGRLLEQSITQARRLVAPHTHESARAWRKGQAHRGQKAPGAHRPLRAGDCPDQTAGCGGADHRPADLALRPRRPTNPQGKISKPNEFGYVAQICEVTENTKREARGLILPSASAPGNPGENTLLPDTVAELTRLQISPREIVLDGGFQSDPTSSALSGLEPERVFISGRQQPGSARTQRRLQRYRTGAEGRISHLKRGYGLRRSRLKGHEGQRTWTGWSILTYNLDTLAIRTS